MLVACIQHLHAWCNLYDADAALSCTKHHDSGQAFSCACSMQAPIFCMHLQSSGDAVNPSRLHRAKQQRQTGLQSSAEEDDARGALADQDAGKQAGAPQEEPCSSCLICSTLLAIGKPGEGGLTEQHTLAAAEPALAAAVEESCRHASWQADIQA